MKISRSPVKKVPLATKGELSIYFIGCGSAFAKTLKQNNILVAKGDRNILIDCGGTCSQSLYEVGVSLPEIDTYLITHSHADHIGGLEEVHMMGRYVLNKKPTMIINKAYEKILWEQSLRGGSEMSEQNPLGFKDFWTIIRPEKRVNWEIVFSGGWGSWHMRYQVCLTIFIPRLSWFHNFYR